jgi:hypothetical protein
VSFARQQRAAFQLLLVLARLDPPIEPSEERCLLDAARRMGLGWDGEDGRAVPALADLVTRLTSARLRRLVLDQACWLALADHHCTPGEHARLRLLASEWDLPLRVDLPAPVGDLSDALDAAQQLLRPDPPAEERPADGPRQIRTTGTIEVEVQGQQICTYCRERLGSRPRRLLTCSGCRVVYHRACILEFGCCATAGCRNNRRT